MLRFLRKLFAGSPAPVTDDRGEALCAAVTLFESRFIGWAADDPRWPLLCEALGLAQVRPPIRRPSLLIPFVRFELNGDSGTAPVFCDPATRTALATPRVPAERVLSVARVEAGVLQAEAECRTRRVINDLLKKEELTARQDRNAAVNQTQASQAAAGELDKAIRRLDSQFNAWKAAMGSLEQLRREEAQSEAGLTRSAAAAERKQTVRSAALNEFAAIPTFPPSAVAEEKELALRRAVGEATEAVAGARRAAAALDVIRGRLDDAVRSESSARSGVLVPWWSLHKTLTGAQQVFRDAASTARQLGLESPVSETRNRLRSAAAALGVDPDRVLAAATAKLLWTAVTWEKSPDKLQVLTRLRAAAADLEAVVRRAEAIRSKVDASLSRFTEGKA